MVLAVNIHFPFYIGAGAVVLGMAILATAHRLLTQAERVQGLGVVEDQAEGVPVS
jgi:MFS transporter, ACDE family, multidrug resistance protein